MTMRGSPKAWIGEINVYLHITSAGGNGPYAWCARIVDGDMVAEIGGTSSVDHDTRLTVIGMTEALNFLKTPYIVKLICSNYEYAVKYVLDRLDPSMEEGLRKRKVSNLDLFPELRSAVRKHVAVEGVEIHKDDRDEEHLRAIEAAKRLLEELKETPSPIFQPISRVADSTTSAAVSMPW
ncbi:MAG: hypothetical protein U1E25_00260 [Methylocystis sp.]